jgi:hypothetical protein
MAIILVVAALCGVAGYFIGKPKNRAVEGAVWGFLLGVIGIIIIAVRKPAEPKSVTAGAPADAISHRPDGS